MRCLMPRLAGPLLVIQVSQPQPDMFFMKNNSSEKLLARYLEGDPAESFDASLKIHARYQNRLILLARSRLLGVFRSKVDADDITQEVFVAFFEMAKRNEIRWKDRGDLWRLLAGIAINKVKQQHERFSTIKRNAHNESRLTTESSAVDEREIDQLAELVEHVLESEKPLVATILNLRLAGFSFEEITNFFLTKKGNTLSTENMIPFEEMNERIWSLSTAIFAPCAASRLITQNQIDQLINTGLEAVSYTHLRAH